MALDTGVDIKLQVTGEKLLKQAFDGVNKEVSKLSGFIGELDTVLLAYEKSQKQVVSTSKQKRTEDEKTSSALKNLRSENTVLTKQQELLAKSYGLSRAESRLLAQAQTDLVSKAKELGYHGAASSSYIEGQNRKILEQIRLNKDLKKSLEDVESNRQKVSTSALKDGDQAVALFRANELKKQNINLQKSNLILFLI
jgi:hypothetical protein